MTDNIIENKKQKKSFLMIAAFVTFVIIAIHFSIPVISWFRGGFLIADSTFYVWSYDVNIFLILTAIAFIAVAFLFFRVAFLGKGLSASAKKFIWAFVMVNIFWIIYAIVAAVTMQMERDLPGLGMSMFQSDVGSSIVGIILSIAFLYHTGDSSKAIKALTNKWLVFALVSVFFIYFSVNFISAAYESLRFYGFHSFLSSSDFIAPYMLRFPFMKMLAFIFCGFSMFVFLVSLSANMPLKKFALGFTAVGAVMLISSIIYSYISYILFFLQFDREISLGLVFSISYLNLSGACLFIALCCICRNQGAEQIEESVND